MLWTVAGAKGGVGTSVTAAALAVEAARMDPTRPVTVVDLAGDQADLLGIDACGQGVREWLRAGPEVDGEALERLSVEITGRLRLVPAGGRKPPTLGSERIARFVEVLDDMAGLVIVDVGVAEPDPVAATSLLMASSARRTAVVRACYLALRRAQRIAVALDDIVEVREGGRALTTIDVEAVVGQPVAARIPFDPGIARVVDAGLLVARPPRSLRRAARSLLLDAGFGARSVA